MSKFKTISKKCLIAFIVLNIFGCILITITAEQSKKSDYNSMVASAKLNYLYKTTSFNPNK